jgi:hypothetical protein
MRQTIGIVLELWGRLESLPHKSKSPRGHQTIGAGFKPAPTLAFLLRTAIRGDNGS